MYLLLFLAPLPSSYFSYFFLLPPFSFLLSLTSCPITVLHLPSRSYICLHLFLFLFRYILTFFPSNPTTFTSPFSSSSSSSSPLTVLSATIQQESDALLSGASGARWASRLLPPYCHGQCLTGKSCSVILPWSMPYRSVFLCHVVMVNAL